MNYTRTIHHIFKRHHSSFHITPELKQALEQRKPIVALESTIISHGMPYPQNVETAREVEAIVRQQGAIPATIAILKGKVHIDDNQLEYLGKTGRQAIKTSSRDLPYVVAMEKTGATTVAGTMKLAEKIGIPVFVTGGIGGVHRGAEESFDVSADLTELGRTPIAVLCAGVKSILDIEKTLEVLETQGVTVATIGEHAHQFPAFYTPTSGFKSPLKLDNVTEAAKIMVAHHHLRMKTGMLFAVPIPEGSAADAESIQIAIQTAIMDARKNKVTGKDETPFLLKRITELTEGKSLASNIALVKNNAKIGGQLARVYAEMYRE
ncbi:Indigoidine synthase A family protein [Pilobolus umbonatus]|nr:Indigoidine synthase A family protein [Pilobolus umbonatus]